MNNRQSSLPRAALFIDGANLYATTKNLGFDIDYKKLLKHMNAQYDVLRAFYYTAMIEDQEYSSIRPLVDWLDYNGYRVVTKPVKEFTDSMGRRKYKGNMDIELALDAVELAEHIDVMILFSGDGDFTRLVEVMGRRGVRTVVVSTIQTQPAMIADDLRRKADTFIDLAQMAHDIGRDASPDRHAATGTDGEDGASHRGSDEGVRRTLRSGPEVVTLRGRRPAS
jgi:uncharacterized LabA/DUF88 family protein